MLISNELMTFAPYNEVDRNNRPRPLRLWEQKRRFECASAVSVIASIAIESLHRGGARDERKRKMMSRAGSGDDRQISRGPPYHAAIRPWSQRAQISRHIAEPLQYNRVRKLANVRIACTLEATAPASAGSRDIPSARLIAAALALALRNCYRRCATARLRNCTIRKSRTRRPDHRRVTMRAL